VSPPAAVRPLFRRSFTTGRYASLYALAAAFEPAAAKIVHRTLSSPLSFPGSGSVQTVMDAVIEQAFVAAGEQALAAPAANAISLYWLSTPGGFVPHAILVDAIEPLWRYRPEPSFDTPISTDPSFRIVTIQPTPSLEVAEAAASPTQASVATFIVSTGGTRTVALFRPGFAPPPGGTTVSLRLHRPASAVYGNGDEAALIAALAIPAEAPWEGDHV